MARVAAHGDRGGKKDRAQIHENQVRWLDKQEAREEDRIKAAMICGSVRKVARRFDKLVILKRIAWRKEQDMLANTSLKDIIH